MLSFGAGKEVLVNSSGNVNTKCPYFLSERAKKIFCLGYENARVALCFPTEELKKEYQENFCFTYCFRGCRIAQICEEENSEV